MHPSEAVEVVISGIGGNFPEANNLDQLKKNLFDELDMITVDSRRWDPDSHTDFPQGTGKIYDPVRFDAAFFNVNPKVCSTMDPVSRIMLEKAFEAICDSGNNPLSFKGNNIAVYTSFFHSEMEPRYDYRKNAITTYSIVGEAKCMFANRISYYFHFTGPSCCYLSSFTGGTEVLKAAAEQIIQGYIDSAIVVVGTLHANPALQGEFVGLGTDKSPFLCGDGKCRSFDAQASGYARSEAVVCFFLQKKSEAKRNYGTIVHSDMSMFGDRQCAFVDIEEKLGTDLLRQFYGECGIDPSTIAYLEADGCAIKRTDSKELNFLSKIFCPKRTSPLLIGSVKSNLGHTEVSSSLVSICKAVIAMEAGMIPPNLHYNSPNPEVPALVNGQLKVVTRPEQLTGDLVAVNTVSFTGAISHVLLRRNPKPKKSVMKNGIPEDNLPRLILTSARHLPGINKVNDMIKTIPLDTEFVALVNNLHKQNIGGYMYRSYCILPEEKDIIEQETKELDQSKRKIWFVFSGMGSQWNGMGNDLMKLPIVAASIEKSHKILEPLGINLKHLLTDMGSNVFQNILNSFVGIASIQIALVDLLNSLGIVPDGIVGHSVGELGCAYADGCFTAEEMILSAYARGKASLETPLIKGMMAAVGLGYNQIKNRLPETIQVACHNSNTSCTLSGPADDVNNFVEQLKKENIFTANVNVGNIAFHSRYVAPAAPALLNSLKQIIKDPKPRSSKWISSSVPEADWGTSVAQLSSPEYHTNNLLGFVLFEEACRHIPEGAVCIEIAPHGLLQSILNRALPVINVALTSRSAKCNLRFLLKAIGTLYLNNLSLDVNAIYPAIDYPVSRGTTGIAQLLSWNHDDSWEDVSMRGLVSLRLSCMMETNMKSHIEENQIILGHKINNHFVHPIADLLILVWNTYSRKKINSNSGLTSVVFEKILIFEQIMLLELERAQLVWSATFGTGNFEVLIEENGENIMIMKGKISLLDIEEESYRPPITEEFNADYKITQQEFYSFLQSKGYQLSNHFKAIKEINLSEKECRGQVLWENNWLPFLDSVFKANEFFAMKKSDEIEMTSYIRKLKINVTNFTSGNIGVLPFFIDSNCKSLHCSGLEIVGAEFRKYEIFNSQSKLVVEKFNFLPISDNYSQMNQFLSVTLELMREASLLSWKKKRTILVIYEIRDKSTEYLSQQLEEIINNQTYFKVESKVVLLEELNNLFSQKPTTPHLILLNSKHLNVCAAKFSKNDPVFFLGMFSGELFQADDTVVPILQHKSFAMHKMYHHYTVKLFKMAEEVIKINVIQIIEGPIWLYKLREQVMEIENTGQIVIFWNHKPELEIIETCKVLTKEVYACRLSCFFILDKNAPVFSLKNPFYTRQLSLGLPVNILSGGQWESIQRMLMTEVQDTYKLPEISIQGLDIYYLGLTSQNTTEEQRSEIEIRHIEYSGYTEGGDRVMGLAIFDQFEKKFNSDNILKWNVPLGWDLEDSVTVPIAYVTAYFGLLLNAGILKNDSILVNAGLSPMGEAAIAVALQYGANVYTTIASDQQATALIERFPNLNQRQILCYQKQFDIELLMQTKGKGVRIIVNNMDGIVLQKSWDCLAPEGRFIQLRKADMEKKEQIGMFNFNTGANFYGVATDNIFNTTKDWKLQLRGMLEDGIKGGVVKPFSKKVFSHTQSNLVINFLNESIHQEKAVINLKKNPFLKTEVKKTGFKCDPSHSYLIVGKKTELWIDLTEWLITQGARTVMVATNNRMSNNSISLRINALVSQFGATIIQTSADKTNTVHSAIELLEEVNKIRPLAAIFNLFVEANSYQVKHLDIASREVVPELSHFVCLLGGDSAVCNERRQAGLPALMIQCDSPLSRSRLILKCLKQVMDHQDTTTYPQLILLNDSVNSEMSSFGNTINLPSFEELCNIGPSEYKRPHLEEVTTLSPRFHTLPKCASTSLVFIFPGLSTARMEPLVKKLLYPSYSVNLPREYCVIEQLAAEVVEEILKVNNAGPYTLLSETWSGNLAIEVGRQLEALDLKVILFLLDASPSIVKGWAKMIGQPNTAAFDEKLLFILLNLNFKTQSEITKASNWEERLECALKSEDKKKNQNLKNSLISFRSMFTALYYFKPSDILFKGKVYFLQYKGTDSVDLELYCKAVKMYTVADATTHAELISSDLTAQIINKNSNSSWY